MRFVLLLCAVLLAGRAQAQPLDRALFQMDWIPTGEHAAWYAGAARGFWRENGIDISLTRGFGSGDTVNKVGAGAAQFGVADIGPVMAARARQQVPMTAIMQVYTHSPHSLFVLRSSGITSFRGLEGKRISITPGNSHRLYFPEVARRAGTDAERITWVNMDASAMAAMLISRRVDAAPFFAIHHFYQNRQAQRAGEEIIALPFVETGFAIYSTALITQDAIIQQNPDLVRRFLRGAVRSVEWARDNQVEACRLHVARNPEVEQIDCEGSLRAVMTYVFNDHQRQTGLGRMAPDRLSFTWQNVASSLQMEPNWDPAQAINTSFLP